MKTITKNLIIAILMLSITILSSCKKPEEVTPQPEPQPIDTTTAGGGGNTGGGGGNTTPQPYINLEYDYIKWVYEGQTDTIEQKCLDYSLESAIFAKTTTYDYARYKKVIYISINVDNINNFFKPTSFPYSSSYFTLTGNPNMTNHEEFLIEFIDSGNNNAIFETLNSDFTKSYITITNKYKDKNGYPKYYGTFKFYLQSGKYIVGTFDTHS